MKHQLFGQTSQTEKCLLVSAQCLKARVGGVSIKKIQSQKLSLNWSNLKNRAFLYQVPNKNVVNGKKCSETIYKVFRVSFNFGEIWNLTQKKKFHIKEHTFRETKTYESSFITLSGSISYNDLPIIQDGLLQLIPKCQGCEFSCNQRVLKVVIGRAFVFEFGWYVPG